MGRGKALALALGRAARSLLAARTGSVQVGQKSVASAGNTCNLNWTQVSACADLQGIKDIDLISLQSVYLLRILNWPYKNIFQSLYKTKEASPPRISNFGHVPLARIRTVPDVKMLPC